MPRGNVPLENQQPPQLPPAFVNVRDQIASARKTLLKDTAFKESAQLRQFIAQYVLPLMDTNVVLFGSAFVDTYALATRNHEDIKALEDDMDEGGSSRIDLDDLNDLQKAFFTLGSVIEKKNDTELSAAYEACARVLADFVADVMEDARDADRDRDRDNEDDERAEEEAVTDPLDPEVAP